MIITADSDLSSLLGVRVRIDRNVTGQVTTHYGVFRTLMHLQAAPGNAGGMLDEEPYLGTRGGMTGFALPYGSIVTLA